MKILISWKKKNGKCRCWTNADPYEHTVMSAAAFSEGINRVAEKQEMTFAEALEKFYDWLKADEREDDNR